MMKKILCILFALLLCTLTACGGNGDGSSDITSGDASSADTLSPEAIKGEWKFDWKHGYNAPDLPVADSVKNLAFRFADAYEVASADGIRIRFEYMNEYCTPNSFLQLRIIVTNNTEYALTYVANNKELYFGDQPFIFEEDCVPPNESSYYVAGDTIYGPEGSEYLSDPLECGETITFERIYWVDSADFEALKSAGATSVDLKFNFNVMIHSQLSCSATAKIPMVDLSAS